MPDIEYYMKLLQELKELNDALENAFNEVVEYQSEKALQSWINRMPDYQKNYISILQNRINDYNRILKLRDEKAKAVKRHPCHGAGLFSVFYRG